MTILKVRIVATREVNPMGKAKLFKPLYKLLEILPSHFLQINSKPGEIQESGLQESTPQKLEHVKTQN